MTRSVFCEYEQREAEGLDYVPWPGELGKRIYENVSVDAWRQWEDRMKMILNEYRLMPFQKEAQELVAHHPGLPLSEQELFAFGLSAQVDVIGQVLDRRFAQTPLRVPVAHRGRESDDQRDAKRHAHQRLPGEGLGDRGRGNLGHQTSPSGGARSCVGWKLVRREVEVNQRPL